jgi:hypothetical protein
MCIFGRGNLFTKPPTSKDRGVHMHIENNAISQVRISFMRTGNYAKNNVCELTFWKKNVNTRLQAENIAQSFLTLTRLFFFLRLIENIVQEWHRLYRIEWEKCNKFKRMQIESFWLSECVIEQDVTRSVIPKMKLLFLSNLKTCFNVSWECVHYCTLLRVRRMKSIHASLFPWVSV